jgi:hypothetical protein
MNLAALDRLVGAEGATDDFAQRLSAVDDEQPADLGIKPALDQVVDERLHDGGVLGCSFDQGKWMFVAFSINAEGSDQHQVVADVQPVDLDDQEVQLGQVRRHPLGQPARGR